MVFKALLCRSSYEKNESLVVKGFCEMDQANFNYNSWGRIFYIYGFDVKMGSIHLRWKLLWLNVTKRSRGKMP